MLNIWNTSSKTVTEHVNGCLFDFPPHGCLQVSERKAQELLKLRPEELSLTAPGAFSEADVAALEKMPRESLLSVARSLMSGRPVDRSLFPVEPPKAAAADNSASAARQSAPSRSGKA